MAFIVLLECMGLYYFCYQSDFITVTWPPVHYFPFTFLNVPLAQLICVLLNKGKLTMNVPFYGFFVR